MHYYSHDHHGLVAYLAAVEFFVVHMQLPLVGTWVLEYDLLGFWDVIGSASRYPRGPSPDYT